MKTMKVICIFSDKFVVLALVYRFVFRVVVVSGIPRERTQSLFFPTWRTVFPAPCIANFLSPRHLSLRSLLKTHRSQGCDSVSELPILTHLFYLSIFVSLPDCVSSPL